MEIMETLLDPPLSPPTTSLVPRPSSRAVDPLPEKVKREEGLVKLITRLTSRVERR